MKTVIEVDTLIQYIEDRMKDCKTEMSNKAELFMLKEDFSHRADYWRSKNLLEAYENLLGEINKLPTHEI